MLRLSANHARRATQRGFTLIELVVVLAILGILLALAVPRYIGVRKRAFKEEAANILAELKTLSWAYYQEYDSFTGITPGNIGLTMPAGSRWTTPTQVTNPPPAAAITWTATGALPPLVAGDTCSVGLYGDGSSNSRCSF